MVTAVVVSLGGLGCSRGEDDCVSVVATTIKKARF